VSAELRVATPEDTEPLVDYLNSIAIELYGEPDLTAEELRRFLAMPQLEVVVAERAGQIVGGSYRRREEVRDRCWLDVRVPAGAAGLAAELLRDIERRAAADVDPGARAMTYVSSRDDTVRGVVEAAGYGLVRASYYMAIAFDEPPQPVWPEGIEVGTYDPDEDEAAVYEAQQESFRDHWEHVDRPIEEWRSFLVDTPAFDPSFWFVAREGGEVAGICLCRTHWSGDPEQGYVSTLGVRRPWRKRGLGLALLQHSFADMIRRGMTRASLDVDAESITGAVGLYERAGMSVERRFDCFQKTL
jgi:ribosomal protein S18 acetylase RimI-like enzyme